MTHPVAKIIEDYERMRHELRTAISAAGGNADAVMQAPEWAKVMSVLVANNITLECNYISQTVNH